jgi:hypothetical protein
MSEEYLRLSQFSRVYTVRYAEVFYRRSFSQ